MARHSTRCGGDHLPAARGLAGSRPDRRDRDPTLPPDEGPLTGRELEVLALVATGRSNREIAGDLLISDRTVARHVANIFVKLDVPSRAAATAHGLKHRLI